MNKHARTFGLLSWLTFSSSVGAADYGPTNMKVSLDPIVSDDLGVTFSFRDFSGRETGFTSIDKSRSTNKYTSRPLKDWNGLFIEAHLNSGALDNNKPTKSFYESVPQVVVNGTHYPLYLNETISENPHPGFAFSPYKIFKTRTIPSYDCGNGDFFTQEDANLWSNLYVGDDSFAKDPCPIISDPEVASSELDARDDPVADGSYTNATYASLADVPNFGAPVARRDMTLTTQLSSTTKPAPSEAPVICRDVHASSRTIYVDGTAPANSVINGKLGLHVNVCFQNGKVVVDKIKNTPFIETLPSVDRGRALLGYQWKFDSVSSSGSLAGVSAGCENDCTQYRVTYQGQLIQKVKGGGGGEVNLGGIGPFKAGAKLQGNVDVDRPGQDARITIVVRATDGATFCAPSQVGFGHYTGKASCLHWDN